MELYLHQHPVIVSAQHSKANAAAVIWKLEDMTRKGELKECDNRTCTSKPQQWRKGGKREVSCSPVMSTSIVKPRHASDRPGKRKGEYMAGP